MPDTRLTPAQIHALRALQHWYEEESLRLRAAGSSVEDYVAGCAGGVRQAIALLSEPE